VEGDKYDQFQTGSALTGTQPASHTHNQAVQIGPNMVEELWYHALLFLDKYRTGPESCDIKELYQFSDRTGILTTHQQCLAQPYVDRQVDMKIMYYELIKMITAHERDHCQDEELYDKTRTVAKIEGYQELTNKMQRFLNQRFIVDIEELNKKHVGDSISISGDVLINQRMGDLEKKFELLEADNKFLIESSSALESANKLLSFEIEKLKETIIQMEEAKKLVSNSDNDSAAEDDKLISNEPVDNKFHSPVFDEKNIVREEAIAKLDDKMEKVINQANTLLINDATHLERICKLEKHGAELAAKLSNLESADLYLQESHKMVTERTSLVEKYSKYVEEKVNLITNKYQEEVLAKPKYEVGLNVVQEGLERRIDILERSVSDLQNARNAQQEIIDINSSKSTQGEIEDQSASKDTGIPDKASDNDSELVKKYSTILGKVEKMETLLGLHSQSITDFSKMIPGHLEKDQQKETLKICKETIKEIKSEKLESSSHIEIHSKDLVDKNLAIDIILLKAEVGNIKNQLQQYGNEYNCENHKNIFEFLEIVVGMNKSLNEMMEEFVSSQAQVKLIKSEQDKFFNELKEDKNSLEHVFNDSKICETEMMSQKIDDMRDMLHIMRQNIEELQKIHNINKSANLAKADSIYELKNKGLSSSRQGGGNSKWLGNWFTKQQRTICC